MSLTRPARLAASALVILAAGCGQRSGADPVANDSAPEDEKSAPSAAGSETPDEGRKAELVLAGGCFWCVEVAFEQLTGVLEVVSGYAGGTAETADYQSVSSGRTNHAEAVRITYDPTVIEEETLLRVFFLAAHDPTQINRQYPDIGRQYRSAVFYTSEEQKRTVRQLISELDDSGQFEKPIATMLEPLDEFYVAEDYHQDYVKHHPREPYVVAYSLPKAAKVRKMFPELIRKD